MPPLKKRKLLASDTDSGASEPSAHPRGRKPKKRSKKNKSSVVQQQQACTTVPDQDTQIVSGFVSMEELERHADSLGIRRILLANLCQDTDLDTAYVGGKVMAHYSQGKDELGFFIQDESTTDGSQPKHLRVSISREIAEKVPKVGDDARLFFHKVTAQDEERLEFSQDHKKFLLVSGTEARIWIVHKDVQDPKFFSLTSSCGKRWWERTRKKREVFQSFYSMQSATASKDINRDGGMTVEDGRGGGGGGEEAGGRGEVRGGEGGLEGEADKLRHDDNKIANSRQEYTFSPHPHLLISCCRSEDAAAMETNSKASQETFPDNSDFPDSAFCNDDDDDLLYFSSPSESSSSSSSESDREWIRKKYEVFETGRQYQYTKLSELQVGNKKTNIFGVVKEFKSPTLSCGSDYYSTLTLVDETDPKIGIKCVMFNKNTDKLPRVKRVGDIVCLHRVSVNTHNFQLQLQGVRFSSSIRFSGELNKKITPHTGSVSFTFSMLEKMRVRELQEWAREQRREYQQDLQSVIPGDYFDLVCQVVGVSISKVPHCVVLSVWDGTLHTLQSRKLKLEELHKYGYPIIKEDAGLSEQSKGTETDIVIYNRKCMKKAAKVHPGQILYLKNIRSVIVDTDMVEICMSDVEVVPPDSVPPRIEVLDPEDKLSIELEKNLKKSKLAVTVTRNKSQPLLSIAEITSYDQVFPAKFRCRVKVQSVIAPSLEDMVLLQCKICGHYECMSRDRVIKNSGESRTQVCPVCSEAGDSSDNGGGRKGKSSGITPPYLSCFFSFKLNLRDSSGEMVVDVPHQQAVQLFNKLKPNNLYQYQELRYQLMEKLNILTGGNPPFKSNATATAQPKPRPWVECCIIAVNHEGSIYHCLFDTKLKNF